MNCFVILFKLIKKAFNYDNIYNTRIMFTVGSVTQPRSTDNKKTVMLDAGQPGSHIVVRWQIASRNSQSM